MKINIDDMLKTPEWVTLTKEDVWGEYDHTQGKRTSEGMIIARHEEVCPVFGDVVPPKSVTVICNAEQQNEVEYWLEFVHGCNCVVMTQDMPNNQIAIRSDYMCW